MAQLEERLLVHPGSVQGLRERRRQEAGDRRDANQGQPQGRLRVPVEREPRGDEPQETDPFDRVDVDETDVPFTKVMRSNYHCTRCCISGSPGFTLSLARL